MMSSRSIVVRYSLAFVGLLVVSNFARAAEVLGTVKAVDATANTITVAPKDGGANVVVNVSTGTEWTNEKGKLVKNFALTRIKPGREVTVTYSGNEASKVLLKDNPKKAAKTAKTKKAAKT